MSDNDDIERLLREIDGATASSPPPAKRQENLPAEKSESSGIGVALVVSAVVGVVGLLLGALPWVPGFWLGVGGFFGAFLGFLLGRRLG